jgi:hypothetical protein
MIVGCCLDICTCCLKASRHVPEGVCRMRSRVVPRLLGIVFIVCSCGGSTTTTANLVDLTGDWTSPTGSVTGSFDSGLKLSLVEAGGGSISGTWSGQGTPCTAATPGAVPDCFWSGPITGSHKGDTLSLTLQTGRTTFSGTVDNTNSISGTAQARDSKGVPTAPTAITFVR